jgi:NAD-dependent DNA ligase
MTESPVDENGTPHPRLYARRTQDRVVAEMLGVVKGMICDGVLTDGEAVSLQQWLRSHSEVAATFPGNVLADRVTAVFRDGILDEEERRDLAELMRSLTGETEDQSGGLNRATRLPCDTPPPTVFFDGREFCLTGVFAYGTRKACEAEISGRGGRCVKVPTKQTHYLVIGLEASAAWVQGDHGTKIEHAVRLKSKGHPIAIIPEEHWVEAIQFE